MSQISRYLEELNQRRTKLKETPIEFHFATFIKARESKKRIKREIKKERIYSQSASAGVIYAFALVQIKESLMRATP